MPRSIDTPAPLRNALLVDAIASGGLGLLLTLGAGVLEPLLGLSATLMRWVGPFLLAYALMLVALAPRAGRYRAMTRAVVIGNELWVVASILALVTRQLTPTFIGVAFVVGQAVIVGVFAYMQHQALRPTSALGSLEPAR